MVEADGDEDTDIMLSDDEGEDWRQTVKVIKSLKYENGVLKKNFDSLKEHYLKLNESHQGLNSKHQALREERETVEKQYQQLCESWRSELEEKQRAFADAQAQVLQPNDIDLLKVKLLEEIEAPYKEKCAALARESELAQEKFVRQRRDYEALRNTYDTAVLSHQNEVAALVADHHAEVADLRGRLEKAGKLEGNLVASQTALRVAERGRDEAQLNCQRLKEESEDLRLEKERAVVELQRVTAEGEARVRRLRASSIESAGSAEALGRKNRHLERELRESEAAHAALHQQLLALQSSNNALSTQLRDIRAQHTSELEALRGQYENAGKHAEQRTLRLQTELTEAETKLAEAAGKHMESVQKAEGVHEEKLAAERQLQAGKLREAELARSHLAAQLETTQEALQEARTRLQDAAAAQKEQSEAARHAEADGLQQLQQLQKQLTQETATAAAAGAELDKLKTENSHLKTERANQAERAEAAERSWQEARGKLAEAVEQAKASQAAEQELAERLAAERAEHADHMDHQKKAWALEKSVMLKRSADAGKRVEAKLKGRLQMAKAGLMQQQQTIAELEQAVQQLQSGERQLMRPGGTGTLSARSSPGPGAEHTWDLPAAAPVATAAGTAQGPAVMVRADALGDRIHQLRLWQEEYAAELGEDAGSPGAFGVQEQPRAAADSGRPQET